MLPLLTFTGSPGGSPSFGRGLPVSPVFGGAGSCGFPPVSPPLNWFTNHPLTPPVAVRLVYTVPVQRKYVTTLLGMMIVSPASAEESRKVLMLAGIGNVGT